MIANYSNGCFAIQFRATLGGVHEIVECWLDLRPEGHDSFYLAELSPGRSALAAPPSHFWIQ